MADENPLSMVDHALQYAGRGWPVFRLVGKIPLKGSKGFKDATTDRETLERWWVERPDANIGLATGHGLVVLDVDGPEGLAELQALVTLHGPLPRTLAARTGNGLHAYFAYAGTDIKSSARSKLHVRATGGFVVIPPSLHPNGRRYEWIDPSLTVANLPDWLKEWMINGSKRNGNASLGVTLNSASSKLPSWLAGLPSRGLAASAIRALSTAESTWSPQEQKRIESALKAIPALKMDIWVKMGFILKGLEWFRGDGSDVGFEIWDAWSSTSPHNYPGTDGCAARWRYFNVSDRPDKVTLGTLFALAQDHGWRGIEVEQVNSADLNGHPSAAAVMPAGLSQPVHAIVFPDQDKAGRPKSTTSNARAALDMLAIDCSHDLFKDKMRIAGQAIGEHAGDVADNAILALREIIHRQYGFDAGQVNTTHAVMQKCVAHQFDPVLDYLDGLQWDRVARLATWLHRYMGADDNAYTREVGTKMMVAAVRRAYEPGIKFDQIVVLEGPEGIGKSQAIRILAGDDYFKDKSILTAGDREQQEAVRGVWLYEVSELTGIRRVDAQRLKHFISRQEDVARPAYARFAVELPRRCIFIGTTNDNDYLKSETGNRRFWPVATRQIDLEGIKRDRDQLWAEAAAIEKEGHSIEMHQGLWARAKEEQEQRMEPDAWFNDFARFLVKQDDISVSELLTGALQMQAREINQGAQNRAAQALKQLGFARYRKRECGTLIWRYKRELGTDSGHS